MAPRVAKFDRTAAIIIKDLFILFQRNRAFRSRLDCAKKVSAVLAQDTDTAAFPRITPGTEPATNARKRG